MKRITKEQWLSNFTFKPKVEADVDFDNSTFYDNGAIKNNESGDFVIKADQVKSLLRDDLGMRAMKRVRITATNGEGIILDSAEFEVAADCYKIAYRAIESTAAESPAECLLFIGK